MPNIDQDLQAIMNARYGREVRQSIHDAIRDINTVADNAESVAITSQESAQNNATKAESYAVGGTGSRTGEDTDNAKYYKEEAERLAGVYAVEDNLTSTSTIHSLSANQGRVLNGKVTDIENSVGSANGIATLDGTGRVPYSQLPESAMEFKGTWNANTNTPTLIAGVGDTGDFYVVSVGGTWHGMTFNPNDRIVFDGVTAHDWIKLVAGEVNSVNGMSGQVQLNADDVPFDGTGATVPLVSTDTQSAILEVLTKAGVQTYECTKAYYLAHKAELDASGKFIIVTDSGIANSAANVSFDNTGTDLANNVQGAIKGLYGKTYSVTSDGTKTRKQMLDSLFTLMNADGKSFTPGAYLMLDYLVTRCVNISTGAFNSFTSATATATYMAQITVANGTSSWSSVTIGSTYSVSDVSSSIVESGTVYSLHI